MSAVLTPAPAPTPADFARAYAHRYGFHIVPIPPRKKRPLKAKWGLDVLSDPDALAAYFTEHPDWNMGVVLGPSRICSFDVDDFDATRMIFAEFGWDFDALFSNPTIQGSPTGCRFMFSIPDGIELGYQKLQWPRKDDPSKKYTIWELRGPAKVKAERGEEAQRQDVLPPSIHPDTGKPYVWLTKPNGHFPEPPDLLLRIWQHLEPLEAQFKSVCPWAPKEAPVPKREPRPLQAGEPSVIEAYNAAHDIESTLSRYGYAKHGRRYLSPHSGTGLPGVNVFDDNRCFIHHASDPLCSVDSGQPVSPFDLFRYYEHGGDYSKAVKDAAEQLGMKYKRQPAPSPKETVDPDTGEISISDPPASNFTQHTIFASSPLETAELFADSLPADGKIIYWRDDFYIWNGSAYEARTAVEIHHLLYEFMRHCLTERKSKDGEVELVAFNPNKKHVEDVMHALRAASHRRISEPPSWLSRPESYPAAGELMAFKNGLLHLDSKTLMASTHEMFNLSALPFPYQPQTENPEAWLAFLASLWPEDQQSIDTLQEIIGYLMTDDTSYQKAFMLVGAPRSGKGTILRVIGEILGTANITSPSLSTLGRQFGLQAMIGKRAAILSDARLSGMADQQAIVENILKITGEDSVSIERKNQASWEGKLNARFVFASNETPSFADASGALPNRFIMLRFDNSFLGKEDHSLTKRVLKELPSIINWCLIGLTRLRERGYFEPTESSKEIQQEMRDMASPVSAFVRERCVLHEQASADAYDLFNEWRDWCKQVGRDHPGTEATFGRMLKAAFPMVSKSQPRSEGGERLNIRRGIRVKSGID